MLWVNTPAKRGGEPGGSDGSLRLAVPSVKTAEGPAGFVAMGNLRGVDAREADAELGAVGGDGRDGVAVGDALDGGDQRSRRSSGGRNGQSGYHEWRVNAREIEASGYGGPDRSRRSPRRMGGLSLFCYQAKKLVAEGPNSISAGRIRCGSWRLPAAGQVGRGVTTREPGRP